jgi:hypothetical protein
MKTARWLRLTKWFKRLVFGLAVLVTLLALGLAIESQRAKRAWEACQRELAARGESVEWRTLLAPPVPDDQNLLATPLLAPCFGFGRENALDPAAATNAFEQLRPLHDWTVPLRAAGEWRTGTIMPLTEWQHQLRSTNVLEGHHIHHRFFVAGEESFRHAGPAAATPPPPWAELWARPQAGAVEDLRFLLERHRAELSEIRAAARRPFARLPLEPNVVSESLMARYVSLRSLAQPFRVSAWTELTAGNPDQACTDLETVFALSDAAASQPLLIGALVRVAILESAIQTIWAGLAERRWSEAQLQRLGARLEPLNLVDEIAHCLRGERSFFLVMTTAPPAAAGALPGPMQDSAYHIHLKWPRAFIYRNQINVARAYQEVLIDRLDPAVPSVRLALSPRDHAVRTRFGRLGPYNVFAPMLLPAVEVALEKAAAGQAMVTLAGVACALERHRLAAGEYPDRLEDLTPKFLARIPPDPVNGTPLHYRLEGPQKFILYSIGLDGVDDGGTPAPSRPPPRAGRPPVGDWVWRSHPAADQPNAL